MLNLLNNAKSCFFWIVGEKSIGDPNIFFGTWRRNDHSLPWHEWPCCGSIWRSFTQRTWRLPSGKHTKKTMEHHLFHGQINYFDWAIFKFANCKRLPEGNDLDGWHHYPTFHRAALHHSAVVISDNPKSWRFFMRQSVGWLGSEFCPSKRVNTQRVVQ